MVYLNYKKIYYLLNKQMKILIVLIIILFASSSIADELIYKKIIQTTDPEAVCLDGSSPALYIHQGSEKNKILIVLSGGGFCQGNSLSQAIQQCYQRSKTQLGSSKPLSDEFIGPGILSTNSDNQMSEWTKIFIPYCDGSLYQGYRESPIKYKDSSLYFRGSKMMKANLEYLNINFNLTKADKIVFSGFSAGAIAVTLWTAYLRPLLNDPDVLYSIPDSGIFLNAESFTKKTDVLENQMKILTQLANFDEKPPSPLCNIQHKGEQWKCLHLEYNYKYLVGKFLFINSEYDQWATTEILGMDCVKCDDQICSLESCSNTQMEYMEKYRRSYDLLLYRIMQISDDFSFWSIACSWHIYILFPNIYNSNLEKVPENTGLTPKRAVYLFVFENQKIIQKDTAPWPNNSPCSK